MDVTRKPFQGVYNIIRFNWHFYVLAIAFLLLLLPAIKMVDSSFAIFGWVAFYLILSTISISLFASFYIYDLSGLYKLNWLDGLLHKDNSTILNIHAGFDETSGLLHTKYKPCKLIVFDFYNPAFHTEISIKRARKVYPPYPGTKKVSTNYFPVENDSIDTSFAILAAHEIRREDERILFFKELNRITKKDGQIVVVEHLQDVANFLAYNIGFFHFHTKTTWLKTFSDAGLQVQKEIKITPFITTFILQKNGSTP